MSEWKKVKLDDCLELITYGFTNPMPDTLSGPWKVTAKDINNGRIVFETARHTSQEAFDNDLTDKSRPKKGDILLTKDGTLGRLAIVGDERICINQSVALLRVNNDILSVPYLYYLLSTPLYQAKMLADAGGATIKHIYITRVNQLLIPCPSYDEQCRIANILSRYDSLIENYQKQIKLLEEAAQRLYKEWFVDLHFPGHENTKIVDGVPEGWEKKRIGDIVEYFDKQRKPLSSMQRMSMDKIYPYYGAATLMDYVDNYLFDGIYLLLGEDGTVITPENYPVLQYVWGKFWVNNHAHVLRGKDGISTEFLYAMFNEMPIADVVTGAAQPKISQGRLSEKKVLIPPIQLILKWSDITKAYFDSYRNLSDKIRLLTEARDRLLPKLMSGEIAV